MAQLFSLGHETVWDFSLPDWLAMIRIEMRQTQTVRSGLARAGSYGEQVRSCQLRESLAWL